MEEIDKLVRAFNAAKAEGCSNERLNALANQIQLVNMLAYASDTSFTARRNKITESELLKWERIEKHFDAAGPKKLFDTAFGSGRDLLIAQNRGYDAYGCELSEYLYSDFLKVTTISPKNLSNCDMRSISAGDNFFDIVRHNASFLHMPIIGNGFTVHACLEESYRILKPGGVLYVYLKEGDGFVTIDTLDGLGSRSFQLFNERTLTTVLMESGFKVLEINHYERPRNGVPIFWIEAFAEKPKYASAQPNYSLKFR